MLRWRHRNRLIKLMDGWLRRLRGVLSALIITWRRRARWTQISHLCSYLSLSRHITIELKRTLRNVGNVNTA